MGDMPETEAGAKGTPEPPSSLTLRVFYLRLSRCAVDESMLDGLTVTHTPLTPDTVLELSGLKQQPPPSVCSEKRSVTCSLRRDRVDAKTEEATFVSTAAVRIVSGSVRFEVQNGDERLLVGILETCDDVDDEAAAEKRGGGRRRSWVMKCQAATQRGSGFLRRGREAKAPPAVEVYVVGVLRGTPVVFTRAMQLRFRRRRQVKAFMESIPECAEQAEDAKETANQEHDAAEESEYRCYKPDPEDDDDSLYLKPAGPDADEYNELSWFTAGVRVGVGLSLGICLGVGLLARSYQYTSRTLTRRLISKLI